MANKEEQQEKRDRFWAVYTPLGFKCGIAGFVLAALAAFCFWILFRQGSLVSTMKIALIISVIFAGIFLLAFLLSLFGIYRQKRQERK